MPSFKVAHINEQGQNMIIVPLDSSFDNKSSFEQDGIMGELEDRAHAAGMAGTVVAVWQMGGQMRFKAPRPWHPFFRSIGMNQILSSINKNLYW